jgi:hypothetical protein
MDTHESRTGFRHPSLITLMIVLLTALVVVAGFAASTAQTPERGKKKEVFVDDDLKEGKVPGEWLVVTDLDQSQLDDPSVPVVVDGVNTFAGKGKYAGLMKIGEVRAANRGPKAVTSLQLRWAFVAFNQPDVALLEGYTSLLDIRIDVNSSQKFDIPAIFFNREVKRFTKGRELHGHFYLRVSVQEVRFNDGSVWSESRRPVA